MLIDIEKIKHFLTEEWWYMAPTHDLTDLGIGRFQMLNKIAEFVQSLEVEAKNGN